MSTHKIPTQTHAITTIKVGSVCGGKDSAGITKSDEVEGSADIVVSKTLLVEESAVDDSEDVENVLFAGAESLIQ